MSKAASAAQAEPLTAEAVEAALRSHFAAPRYAVITGVRNAAGWDASRTCDLLALGVWQSTHHDLHGVEIKVHRGDWQREMQDPLKAEAFAAFCDYWWIAAPPGIVRLEELPATWGLIEMVGKGMRVRKPATKKESPAPIDREFLACFARRVCEQSPAEALIAEARRRGKEDAAAEYEKREKRREERESASTSLIDPARKTLADFEALTGIHLSKWNVGEKAAQFKRFAEMDDALESVRDNLKRAKDRAEEALTVPGTVAPPAKGPASEAHSRAEGEGK